MTIKNFVLLIFGLLILFSLVIHSQCEAYRRVPGSICYDLGSLEALIMLLAILVADFFQILIAALASILLIYLEKKNIFAISDALKISACYLITLGITLFYNIATSNLDSISFVWVFGLPIIQSIIGFYLVRKNYS